MKSMFCNYWMESLWNQNDIIMLRPNNLIQGSILSIHLLYSIGFRLLPISKLSHYQRSQIYK